MIHTLLVVIYHMLKDGREYAELGTDYLDPAGPAARVVTGQGG